MCDLCRIYGTKAITDGVLAKAMKAIGGLPVSAHTSALLDAWMGFQAGPESESNAEAAEAWETMRRHT